MSVHSFAAELAQADMGLFACGVLIAVCLGGAIASIVIEQAWIGIRHLRKLWKGRANGR
ncbi:hypothetical protein [Stenotrophomonas maltophilia]|uniref:hypothetical protein n=1 Tax=Stenotrophomonas maltophilia TaxID=40324 RepID=UPI0015EBCDAF|nr:hypothetical protein [Stenotrophomonas maltophilia]